MRCVRPTDGGLGTLPNLPGVSRRSEDAILEGAVLLGNRGGGILIEGDAFLDRH